MKKDNSRDHKWYANRPIERCICLILFVSILLSLSSCSSAGKINLHTDATVIPYAHAQKLDWTGAFTSADTSSRIVGATLVGDQIAVLLRTENEYKFAVFNEKGENTGFSSGYSLSATEGIYGIYSNQKNELLLVTGEYSIDSCERYDREIGDIVEEEAPPYYLGQKSAEEVALIMESRINLILDERKDS